MAAFDHSNRKSYLPLLLWKFQKLPRIKVSQGFVKAIV